jgi:hypothetical protein
MGMGMGMGMDGRGRYTNDIENRWGNERSRFPPPAWSVLSPAGMLRVRLERDAERGCVEDGRNVE